MALKVKVGEAKTRLSELLHRVEAGEEIILSRGPVPVARLAPIDPGGRKEAMVAALRDARDDGDHVKPVSAAELGRWRSPDAPPSRRDAREAAADETLAAPRPTLAAAGGPFVVEPSFAAAWLLPGPDRGAADAASAQLARESAIVAPGFWDGVADLLLSAQRHGRVEAIFAAAQLTRAGRLPINESSLVDALGFETDSEARAAVLRLALARDLSSADAASLALARAGGMALATNLPALVRAAAQERVPVMTDLADVDRN